VLNPLRTRRFAEEELQRTKTDAIDALGIARFAAQKRPPAA
jgi:transposase